MSLGCLSGWDLAGIAVTQHALPGDSMQFISSAIHAHKGFGLIARQMTVWWHSMLKLLTGKGLRKGTNCDLLQGRCRGRPRGRVAAPAGPQLLAPARRRPGQAHRQRGPRAPVEAAPSAAQAREQGTGAGQHLPSRLMCPSPRIMGVMLHPWSAALCPTPTSTNQHTAFCWQASPLASSSLLKPERCCVWYAGQAGAGPCGAAAGRSRS